MKYTLFYVEDGTPKRKGFRSKKALTKFIDGYHVDKYSGYWLDYFVEGPVTYLDPDWRDYLLTESKE